MTAIVAQRLPDRIEIISDGAVYDERLIVRGFECKIDRLPRFNAVMTGRGPTRVLDAFRDKLGELMERASTYDLALYAIGNNLPMLMPLVKLSPFHIVLAGISEEDGPVLHTFGNTSEGGFEPFELQNVAYGTMYGHSIPTDVHATILDRGGLRAVAVDFFNRVRNDPDRSAAAMVVGGHIDFTVVSEAGVTIERIHRWDDVIGRRIASAELLAGMNRQQRRALERQQRKIKA